MTLTFKSTVETRVTVIVHDEHGKRVCTAVRQPNTSNGIYGTDSWNVELTQNDEVLRKDYSGNQPEITAAMGDLISAHERDYKSAALRGGQTYTPGHFAGTGTLGAAPIASPVHSNLRFKQP